MRGPTHSSAKTLIGWLLDYPPGSTPVLSQGDNVSRIATQVRMDGWPTVHRAAGNGLPACGAAAVVPYAASIKTSEKITCHQARCAGRAMINT